MASGVEMLAGQLLKFIPKEVWEGAASAIGEIQGRAKAIDDRLARLEAKLDRLETVLLVARPLDVAERDTKEGQQNGTVAAADNGQCGLGSFAAIGDRASGANGRAASGGD